jgi:hypothetical protein
VAVHAHKIQWEVLAAPAYNEIFSHPPKAQTLATPHNVAVAAFSTPRSPLQSRAARNSWPRYIVGAHSFPRVAQRIRLRPNPENHNVTSSSGPLSPRRLRANHFFTSTCRRGECAHNRKVEDRRRTPGLGEPLHRDICSRGYRSLRKASPCRPGPCPAPLRITRPHRSAENGRLESRTAPKSSSRRHTTETTTSSRNRRYELPNQISPGPI